jgi:pimeloyl-ACP methyl ester carboxylesterase
MRRIILSLLLLLLIPLACSVPQSATPVPTRVTLPTSTPASLPPQPPISEKRCGDSVCDGPEDPTKCPVDCADRPVTTPGPGNLQPQPAERTPLLESAEAQDTYWVTNPTSQAHLYVQVFYPNGWSSESLPTLILVPGGTGTLDSNKARRLTGYGLTVIIFDPDGRGRSDGQEDRDGYIHQDGLAAVIQSALSIPGVDPAKIGLVSYSYGITMASGTLARYPDLPVRFLIDWEGPADRYDTTLGCGSSPRQTWPDCSDDAAWSQREALTFISQIQVPYQRLQSETDHVQPDLSNAISMVNAAVQGNAPWVRLNDLEPDQMYDPDNPPAMLSDAQDRQIDSMIGRFARELFSLVLD